MIVGLIAGTLSLLGGLVLPLAILAGAGSCGVTIERAINLLRYLNV